MGCLQVMQACFWEVRVFARMLLIVLVYHSGFVFDRQVQLSMTTPAHCASSALQNQCTCRVMRVLCILFFSSLHLLLLFFFASFFADNGKQIFPQSKKKKKTHNTQEKDRLGGGNLVIDFSLSIEGESGKEREGKEDAGMWVAGDQVHDMTDTHLSLFT